MAKPTIFISYSHHDEQWKNRLVTQLGVLQQQDYLDIWVDTRIEGGADWFSEIKEAIEASSIAVLLVSANFLNSKFITEQEIPMLLQQQRQKGLRIYPIILTPCDWLAIPWITQSLARPQDGRPLSAGNDHQIEADLAAIASEIRGLLERSGLPREQRTYVPLPPDQISTAKLPSTHHALFGREKELKMLDDAWENPHCHIVCLVAFGGVGKTALVNEWLNRVGADGWRGAQRVYGWSFYSQGTREDKQASADPFFENALQFFGYTGEPPKSAWDKGVLLAKLIRERQTLLILDGLEPLQYPPGIEQGRLRDQGLQALLKELARFNNGLCLITTRCKVTDIAATEGRTTHQLELENLSPQAGRQLLREAGVCHGTDKELEQTAKEYDGHALALTLLGSYLATVHDGEIRKRDLIPQLTAEVEHGGHAKRVMESYEIWLKGTAVLEILYLIGLFDRPAPLGAIHALIKGERINGLTDKLHNISQQDWRYAVKHLGELRLLSASTKEVLDCHPLIREHFADKLKSKALGAWRLAHERLYEYYKNLPQKLYGKELPDTLEEMEPLFAAVAHGCQAGKHIEVYDNIFFKRINRGNEYYVLKKLGAFGSFVATLSNFFEEIWKTPLSDFKEKTKAVIFNQTGFGLRALGRLREAAQPMQAGMEMQAKNKDWKNAASAACNLSELYLTLGEVAQAVRYARQSVDFADRSGDAFEKESDRTTLADALHQAGELAQAADLFRQAEAMQQKRQPQYRYLYSLRGFRFCDLLLDQGQAQEVLERAKQTLEWARQGGLSLLTLALDKLSLGRAYLLEALAAGFPPRGGIKGGVLPQRKKTSPSIPLQRGKPSAFPPLRGDTGGCNKAADYLTQAVAGLREAGAQEFIARGLFARACYYRLQGQFPQAWEDLAEALEIAERGSMGLWLVDYHLESARIVNCQLSIDNCQLFDNGREVKLSKEEMIERLKQHVEQAAALVQQTGYHRRDPEVELGYAGLALAQGDLGRAREHLARGKKLLKKMGIRCWDFEVRWLEGVVG